MERALRKLLSHTDLLAAFGVVLIVTMLVIPLPTAFLDLLITLNISGGLAIVVATMYIEKALDFSAFPTLLLLTTMFRLAINVSVTRKVLTTGDAGSVVHSFGQFVVGGNVIIGLVIFLILVVIQFVVVTNGAGRVAEVGARFTLDAMPGKQMAIDADLNAGLITDEQARARRSEIAREADFYGAMDGASKFVRGDATAAIVITTINLLGGIIIGMLQHHLSFSQATHQYSLLTVGDGLAAQIPALLVSVATGIIVTRSGSRSDLGSEIASQILGQKKAPLVAGTVIIMFALIPGLPKIPFIMIGGALFFAIGRMLRNGGLRGLLRARAGHRRGCSRPAAASYPRRWPARDEVLKELPLDALELGVGFGLVPMVDRGSGGTLACAAISMIRRQIAGELGMVIPPVRIHDEVDLDSHEYVCKVRGSEVARGRIMAGHRLAMDPGDAVGTIPGIPTTEPAFGLPAVWIAESAAARGRGARLHRRRRRVGDRDPPHRDDPGPCRAAVDPPGRASAARPAQGIQRSGRQRGGARRSLPRRDPARSANALVRRGLDQGSGLDRRSSGRQGAGHPRSEPAGRVRPSGAGPRDHRPPPLPRSDPARHHPRPRHRTGGRDLHHSDHRR